MWTRSKQILFAYTLAGFFIGMAIVVMSGIQGPLDPVPIPAAMGFVGAMALCIWIGGAVARANIGVKDEDAQWLPIRVVVQSLPLGVLMVAPPLALTYVFIEAEMPRLAALPLMAMAIMIAHYNRSQE